MRFAVNASITPKAAARLLISREIDVSGEWSTQSIHAVINELLILSIDDILTIIDSNIYGEVADVKLIPQFGKLSTVARVPGYFVKKGQLSADYPQIGLYLKGDPSATLAANTKFGENHGKAAAILGIADCVNKRIIPSAFSVEFCSLDDSTKEAVLRKLLFRIPIIQILLKEAVNLQIDGYHPMRELQESTMRRRGQCLRAIFRMLKEYNNPNLNARIDNIVWND